MSRIINPNQSHTIRIGLNEGGIIMKKILAAICLFAALMGTLGCGSSQNAGSKPAEKKELIVGT